MNDIILWVWHNTMLSKCNSIKAKRTHAIHKALCSDDIRSLSILLNKI